MRLRITLWVLAASVIPPSAFAGERLLSVTVSNQRPGARHVVLVVRFNGVLQCGTVAGSPLELALPAQAHVPRTVAAHAVLINGLPAGTVLVAGHRLTITPKHPPLLCDVLTNGPITLVLTRAAGIGNPARAGTYVVTVRRGRTVLRGRLTIR